MKKYIVNYTHKSIDGNTLHSSIQVIAENVEDVKRIFNHRLFSNLYAIESIKEK